MKINNIKMTNHLKNYKNFNAQMYLNFPMHVMNTTEKIVTIHWSVG